MSEASNCEHLARARRAGPDRPGPMGQEGNR
jgi:hypothetical protein